MQQPARTSRSLRNLLIAAACGLLLVGCSSNSGSSGLGHDGFATKYAAFHYCKAPEIKQSNQRSCGAAALASVIQYWREDASVSEKELLSKYPPTAEIGYPLSQLKEIAIKEQLLAFAVTMDREPLKQLATHVRKGRPVIVALELPKGRYFTGGIPLIETIDRRTVQGLTEVWKSHYVVVMGDSLEEFLIMDPQYGYVQVNKTQFESFWKKHGYAALITSAIPAGVKTSS